MTIKHAALIFSAGGISALALPPFGFIPALFLGIGYLYILTAQSPSGQQAFVINWLFSFGYHAFGLYWIGNALLVEGNPYWWAWPLAVCGLPAILAFFQAFAGFFARKFFDLHKFTGVLAFAALSGFYEWARGHAFTGFPWNLYGHVWAEEIEILQIISVIGIYSLTTLTVFWCGAAGWLALKRHRGLLIPSLLAISLLIPYAYGATLVTRHEPVQSGVRVKLVQGNVPQSEKWDREKIWPDFQERIKLSSYETQDNGAPVMIVWAETAISHWMLDDPAAMHEIKAMLSAYKDGAVLLTGVLRHESETDRYYNSLIMIDADGKISNVYNKNHLVPFGEYIPFQEWIPLEPVARFRGFSGGGKPTTYETAFGTRYSPMICYEIIFSGNVIDKNNRPDFILNVTNDSWYGISPGPYQHLAQARFRAIEEGLPVVRVADTGISAVIDSQGRITAQLGLEEKGAMTAPLPDIN